MKTTQHKWFALLWLFGAWTTPCAVFAAHPAITSFTPTAGPANTTNVLIQGTGLSGTKSITFNGVKATMYQNGTSTYVYAFVPIGATTGYIKLTTSSGTATSKTEFVVQAPPAISSFSPTAVGSDSSVVILNGTNFVPGGGTVVKLNGLTIPGVAYLSGNMLSFTVPKIFPDGVTKSKTGKISVQTTYGSVTSTASLVVQMPDLSRSLKGELPLQPVDVPTQSDLSVGYIKDKTALIALGKALFWDMQVGSDGVQACASCHFQAGADNRSKNQRNPGSRSATTNTAFINNGAGDTVFTLGKGPNSQLSGGDFPFHKFRDTLDRNSIVDFTTNDVSSSQGVFLRQFVRNSSGCGEVTSYSQDNVFHVAGTNTRRVEPRNTPTVINAAFNHRNFWDGRAQNIFNGVNHKGEHDQAVHLYESQNENEEPVLAYVRIKNSSLASQAVAPPLSDTEMSSVGRPFLLLGKRLVDCRPLAKQLVHSEDSVLGKLSRNPSAGLKKDSYSKMVNDAFHDKWHESNYKIRVDADNSERIVGSGTVGSNVYTLMEYNFSLFFGLAIQAYEATLVSDDSPWDQHNAGTATLSADALTGADVFFSDRARCGNCHRGSALTDASDSQVRALGETRIRTFETYLPGTNGNLTLKQRQFQLIDTGFGNIGVRTTLDDLGVGSKFDAGVLGSSDLSIARRCAGTNCGIPLGTPSCFLTPPVLAVDGAMKIPGLRNVALTAPYFHNGGTLTLSDVLDFYLRGSNFNPAKAWDANRISSTDMFPLVTLAEPNFDITSSPVCSPDIAKASTPITSLEKTQMLVFLTALTDERVRTRKAPFDHPQLFVPNGHPGNGASVTNDGFGYATDSLTEIRMTGRNGGTALPDFLSSP